MVKLGSSHEIGCPLPIAVHLFGMHALAVWKTIAGTGKGFRAVRALVGPGSGVLIYVKFQVLIALECFVAQRTGVRPQVRVSYAVRSEGGVRRIYSTANGARKLNSTVVLLVAKEIGLSFETENYGSKLIFFGQLVYLDIALIG